jgi:hypothetical protein
MGAAAPPGHARKFLEDPAPSARKRAGLVEWIFERPEFADYWAMRWADVLRIKSEFPSNLWPNAVQAYHAWLREAFARNTPFDQMARELLTTSGSNFRNPPCNFYRALPARTPAALAQATALIFLGIRLAPDSPECSGLAAFFTNVRYKKTDEWKEEIVYFAPRWPAYRDPRTNAVVPPMFPDGSKPDAGLRPEKRPSAPARGKAGARSKPVGFALTDAQREELSGRAGEDAARDTLPPAAGERAPASRPDPQGILAAWLTSPENPWFAANFANRAWAILFGRGLVHPVDDVRKDNPPSSPELLSLLAGHFKKSRHDPRALLRLIVLSETYQRSARIPAAARRALPPELAPLATRIPRRLEAEVLADAIGDLTGSHETFSSRIPEPIAYWPENFRAVQNPDSSVTTTFLDSFGRPARDSSFAYERDISPSLSQALWLLNSRSLKAKLEKKGGRVEQLVSAHAARERHAALADLFYLTLLSRFPTPGERATLLRHLSTAPATAVPLEQARDILWAIINTKEFLHVH